jgi:hypothetical protein
VAAWDNWLPIGFLTRMEHMVVWKVVISSLVLVLFCPERFSKDFQPQKCTH